MAKTTKTRNKYTDEFRASAVTMAKQTSIRATAKQLDIPYNVLWNWTKKQGTTSASKSTDPFLSRVQAKLAELDQQRNTLEQAVRLLS